MAYRKPDTQFHQFTPDDGRFETASRTGTDVVVSSADSISRLPYFEYRPLIGYLNEVIDNGLTKESSIRISVEADVAEQITDIRQTVDVAMHALQATIRLVQSEMDQRHPSDFVVLNDEAALEEVFWLKQIFPESELGETLMQNYRKLRLRRS